MGREREQRQEIKSLVSTRELFNLGRDTAKKGVKRDNKSLAQDYFFVGSFDGIKYKVDYTQNLSGHQMINLVGRDFNAVLYLDTNDNLKTEEFFNENRKDPAEILKNLSPLPEQEFHYGTTKTIEVYRLWEPDRFNDEPSERSIIASSKEDAREKYLAWCEANNDFYSIMMLLRGSEYFKPDKITLPIGFDEAPDSK